MSSHKLSIFFTLDIFKFKFIKPNSYSQIFLRTIIRKVPFNVKQIACAGFQIKNYKLSALSTHLYISIYAHIEPFLQYFHEQVLLQCIQGIWYVHTKVVGADSK